MGFGIIGATGVVVNTAALWFFFHTLGWNHLVGASLATQVSTTWNFLLVDLPGLPETRQRHEARPGCPLLRHEQPAAAGTAAGPCRC